MAASRLVLGWGCLLLFISIFALTVNPVQAAPGSEPALAKVRDAIRADALSGADDWLLVFATHSEDGPITIFLDGTGRFSRQSVRHGQPDIVGFDGDSAWRQSEHRTRFRMAPSEAASTLLGTWLLTGLWVLDDLPLVLGDPRREKGGRLAIPVAYQGVAGEVRVDSESWLPVRVTWETELGELRADLSEWTEAPGFRVPRRLAIVPPAGPSIFIKVDGVRRFVDRDPSSFLPDFQTYADTTFDASGSTDLVVMTAPTGHLLVQAWLGSEHRGWFIFDTGASENVIASHLGTEVGAELLREISVQGSGGSAAGELWKAESLRVGPVTIDEPVMIGTDLAFLEPHFGVPVSGIIGAPTLARVVAEIDVAKPRIAFHEPRSYAREAVEWQPLVLLSDMPALPATFEGRDGMFIVDLGSTRTGTFYRRAVDRLGLLDNRHTIASGGEGVGGKNLLQVGKLEWFELGGFRYDDVEFAFSRATSGFWAESDATGNLGQELLRDFELLLDYSRQRFSLIPKRP